jgi:hypothetical protein
MSEHLEFLSTRPRDTKEYQEDENCKTLIVEEKVTKGPLRSICLVI